MKKIVAVGKSMGEILADRVGDGFKSHWPG